MIETAHQAAQNRSDEGDAENQRNRENSACRAVLHIPLHGKVCGASLENLGREIGEQACRKHDHDLPQPHRNALLCAGEPRHATSHIPADAVRHQVCGTGSDTLPESECIVPRE